MTRYEGIETTAINQIPSVKIVISRDEKEIYINYDAQEFAQNLANLTKKPVEVIVTQTVIIQPFKELTETETLTEVKN